MSDEELLDRWLIVTAAAGVTVDDATRRETGQQLLARWSEPHRWYHDRRHLKEALTALDLLGGPEPTRTIAELALWFHDAVHAGRPGLDEAASAALAESELRRLGTADQIAIEVRRLVGLTATHRPGPADLAGAMVCDADLAILAAPAARYGEYVSQVRKEWAHLPDHAFAAGRLAVLTELATRPQLYHTAAGTALWQTDARRQLEAELLQLRPNPPS
jgi:predicted metal-dependent HD superfamily phosphohydrolase